MPNKIGVYSKESDTVFNAETLKILQGHGFSYVVSTLQAHRLSVVFTSGSWDGYIKSVIQRLLPKSSIFVSSDYSTHLQ